MPGQGWIRLRWGGSAPPLAFPQAGGGPVDISGFEVDSISIIFDEGQDTGPDNFGLAVLDNIDVNGTLVGRGATDASESDSRRRRASEGGLRDRPRFPANLSSARCCRASSASRPSSDVTSGRFMRDCLSRA